MSFGALINAVMKPCFAFGDMQLFHLLMSEILSNLSPTLIMHFELPE